MSADDVRFVLHESKKIRAAVIFFKDTPRFLLAIHEGDRSLELDMPNDLRIDLAMMLLKADGAKVSVKLTWPKPAKKGKKKSCRT